MLKRNRKLLRSLAPSHRPLSRRNVLQGIAGISSGLLVGCETRGWFSKPTAPLQKRTADVVVIGAGLSGLVAAWRLVLAGVSSVLVLEARDRVGGMTVSQEAAPGVFVDGGGSWIGAAHTRITALAKDFGIETRATPIEGNPVFLFGGLRVAGLGRLFTQEEKKELRALQAKVEAMAQEFPPGEPWKAPRAAEYDKMSMFNFLSENAATVWGKRDIELAVDWKFGTHTEDISLLRFVAAVQAYQGLEPLMAISESQEFSFVGGSQRISQKIAACLGERILLSSPVRRIVDHPGQPLRVETEHLSIECGRVVTAMAPADTRRIEFDPPLPENRAKLVSQWRGSPSYKAHIVYEKPFWRASQLNGIAVGDGKIIDFVFDASPPSGTPGILVAFGAGEELPAEFPARKEAVTNALVTYFAEEASNPINFIDMDWYSDKWSSGCSSALPPGVLSKHGSALREPIGRMHWAGTDTAHEFDGSMEGAVRAGERVAKEVIIALRESGGHSIEIPSDEPAVAPSAMPSAAPADAPSAAPAEMPSAAPPEAPSAIPSAAPDSSH